MAKITKKDLVNKLKGLGDITEEQKRAVTCALIGHSNIMTLCFGYHSCARCGEQVGDSLAGAYSNEKAVYVEHNCDICRTNYDCLKWSDKYLAPTKQEIFSVPGV
jgi:hypothetical protein